MKWTDFHIAIVGPLPPPAGGMANQTQLLADLLRLEGVAVEIVQSNAPYRPAWMARVRGVRAGFRLFPYLRSLWTAAGRADVVHVMANSGWAWHLFAAPAVMVARWRRTPVIVHYHGGEAQAFLTRSAAAVRHVMQRARTLVVPSEFLRDVFLRHDLPAVVIPNVVDLKRFSCEKAGRRDKLHLVVTRNLELIYDVESALRAFAIVRKAHSQATITIAGSGPERDSLVALAASLGLSESVRFVGRLGRDEVVDLLQEAGVVLNPSRVDNLPVSILEAWASGLPVVTTRVGGIPYFVTDQVNAVLVAPGDPQSMAAGVLRVLDDPVFAKRLVDGGALEVRKYAWSSVRQSWAHVYSETRNRSRKRVPA